MIIIEYIVFCSLLLFALISAIVYKPPKKELSPISEIYKCDSFIEERVYNGLFYRGLYATPQYPVGRYRIDLAFPHQMLAVECDGAEWHSTPKQKAHDRKRDKFLRERGWTVLRFSGSKINRNLVSIIEKIEGNL